MSVSKIIRCVAQLPAFPRPNTDCKPPCPEEPPAAPSCPDEPPPPSDPCARNDDQRNRRVQQYETHTRRSSQSTQRQMSAIKPPMVAYDSHRESVYVNTNVNEGEVKEK